jgi:hypothetical protein
LNSIAAFAQVPAAAAGSQGAGTLKVRVEAKQVSAEIRAVPMQQVLEELASRTGVVFQIGIQFNPNVSVVLYRSELGEAIRRVTHPYDSAFYYEEDLLGKPVLRYVRVFPRGMKGQNLSLRYIGNGAITKTSDDLIETPEQAVKALTGSPNPDVRVKAVELLAGIQADFSVLALTQALGDSAPEVRLAAIEALSGLTARASLPAILLSLKDSHPGVRQSAVEAVMILGDAQNVKDLRPLAKDSDATVAAAAELAIRRLSERRP